MCAASGTCGHSASDEDVVLPAQFPFELRFLFRVEFRRLNEIVDVLVQVRVHQLQLRRAMLVEERHGRAVLDRLLEVVDGNVIAEDLLRAFLARDERRAGEGEEQRLGQRRAHVQRQHVVLAAVRLVRQDDHVGPVAEHGHHALGRRAAFRPLHRGICLGA